MKVKEKRVLHIVGAMNKGGTETMLMNLYRQIDREKVQFHFLSFSVEDGYYDEQIKSLGGRVIKSATSINQITKVINDYGPYDVVHAHTLFNSGIAMIAAKKAKVKIRISHAHTTLDNSSNLIRRTYIKAMRYVINKCSTKILACSKEAGKYLFGESEIKKKKYMYFPNLIDYQLMLNKPDDEVNEFKVENCLQDSLVIGHIGTFKEAKNQRFLVEIVKEMKDKKQEIKLMLVGDGSQRSEIEELVKSYNIEENVIFTGTRDDVSMLLHSMDVFVFPSIYEGLGLVLLEAQAAGLPCVVSEAIQSEADLGLGLVKQLNLSDGVEKWSQEILKVKGMKERDLNKIKNAFEDKEYSTDKCISKLIKLYNVDDKRICI